MSHWFLAAWKEKWITFNGTYWKGSALLLGIDFENVWAKEQWVNFLSLPLALFALVRCGAYSDY